MTEKNIASLLPSDAAEGGGLPAVGAHCKLDIKFTDHTLTDKPVPVLMVEVTDVDSGEDYGQQYYTIGSPESWAVSEDGKNLIPIAKKKVLLNSDFMQFVIAAINAGFPEDRLSDGDITKLSGMTAIMGQIPALTFDGKPRKRTSKKDGKEYDATLLVPVEVKNLPGANPNKKKGTAAGSSGKKASTASKKKVATDDNEAAKTKATEFIIDQLAEAGEDGLPKKGLAGAAMKHFLKDEDRGAIVTFCGDDTFLGESDVWNFENGIISIA